MGILWLSVLFSVAVIVYNFFVSCCEHVGSHLRFDAKSPAKAMEWVEAIRQAISDEQEREKLRVSGILHAHKSVAIIREPFEKWRGGVLD